MNRIEKSRKISAANSSSLIQSRWNKFHTWEKEYDAKRLNELTPVEKIRILEDLYLFVSKVKNSVMRKSPHFIRRF
ncbi:MAG: hypothetical protein BWK75_02500 [Candidatus Altiarchaeales archaeon A3]|nr:MAG: hypothetical protein BWK75_02500 [Candidatus Altiarchaeales archaeon A3]